MIENEIDEKYRISQEELKEFFNNRREITFDEYKSFLKWREERKARNEQI